MSWRPYSAGAPGMVLAHLVESGELTLDDVKEAEKALRNFPERTNRHDRNRPFACVES